MMTYAELRRTLRTTLSDAGKLTGLPIDTVYGSLTNGVYSRIESIELAKGRVTAYDNQEITLADAELVLNYIVNNVALSNIQKFLADYNDNGIVDIADVVLMKQCIAA